MTRWFAALRLLFLLAAVLVGALSLASSDSEAAKCPTFCLSMPVIVMLVGSGTVTVIPSGTGTSIAFAKPTVRTSFFLSTRAW